MKPLKKVNKKIEVGSIVQFGELFKGKWFEVKEIASSRCWIKVKGLEGSFQAVDITKWTNVEMV